MLRTSNPALSERTFETIRAGADVDAPGVMTVQGTINKTAMLLALLIVAAGWTWHLASAGAAGTANPQAAATAAFQAAMPWMFGGLIGGLVVGLIIAFVPKTAPYLAWAYAGLEGLLLGGLSCFVNTLYEGVAMQAIGCTFAVCAVMLVLYSTRIIKVTQRFAMGVVAATGGIMLFYLVAIVGSWLGFGAMAGMLDFQNGSLISIGFSVLVVIIAALNLALDFSFIERGADSGAPKYMEWYGAFGLMVTLVWLYIEVLRLLSKLRSR